MRYTKILRIINSNLFYRSNESSPHRSAGMIIQEVFIETLNQKTLNRKLKSVVPTNVMFNKYSCGVALEKTTDAAISTLNDRNMRFEPLVAYEIVFGNKSFSEMVFELRNYLNEFGTSIYSIGCQFHLEFIYLC